MGMRTMPTQPTFSTQSMTLKQPDPKQVQMDLLAKYQAVYADYAAGVTKLEQETAHISAKNYTHRQRFYWLPLNKFSEQLQSQYQINGYQLAQIVSQGLEEEWPTKDSKDSRLGHTGVPPHQHEQRMAPRHAEAQANMVCLDACPSVLIAAGTAAGTAGNQVAAGARIGGGVPRWRYYAADLHRPWWLAFLVRQRTPWPTNNWTMTVQPRDNHHERYLSPLRTRTEYQQNYWAGYPRYGALAARMFSPLFRFPHQWRSWRFCQTPDDPEPRRPEPFHPHCHPKPSNYTARTSIPWKRPRRSWPSS